MESLSTCLLDWYDRHARKLPWRIPPHQSKQGIVADPYHVWLSEVMLQQTGVVTVKNYFEKFLCKWPTIDHLAAADTEDVMKAWAGLGYYSRARNLKACAQVVANELCGRFPETAQELEKLPGIGPYTAAAISAIAYGGTEPVVDGNIERVCTRHRADSTPLPKAKAGCRDFMAMHTPAHRSGDFIQAMMDLGATICTPRNPACNICPISTDCLALNAGNVTDFPVRLAKRAKPTRVGAAYVAQRSDGAIWLTRRVQSGLLGGMTTVPTTGWTAAKDGETGTSAAPAKTKWARCGTVKHTFTHFHLQLEVWRGRIETMEGDGWWSPHNEISNEALPSLMRKVITAADSRALSARTP